MLDQRMQDAINSQINWELYSGYLYLSMASKFADLGMSGGQNWMTVQYQEELAHARIMFSYVLTRGGRVIAGRDRASRSRSGRRARDVRGGARARGGGHGAHPRHGLAGARAQGPRHVQLPPVVHRRAGRGGGDGRRTWCRSSAWRASTRPASTSSTRSSRPALSQRAGAAAWRLERPDHQQAGVLRPPHLRQLLERAEARRPRRRPASPRTRGPGRSARASSRAGASSPRRGRTRPRARRARGRPRAGATPAARP